jgi:hypothetical protein
MELLAYRFPIILRLATTVVQDTTSYLAIANIDCITVTGTTTNGDNLWVFLSILLAILSQKYRLDVMLDMLDTSVLRMKDGKNGILAPDSFLVFLALIS